MKDLGLVNHNKTFFHEYIENIPPCNPHGSLMKPILLKRDYKNRYFYSTLAQIKKYVPSFTDVPFQFVHDGIEDEYVHVRDFTFINAPLFYQPYWMLCDSLIHFYSQKEVVICIPHDTNITVSIDSLYRAFSRKIIWYIGDNVNCSFNYTVSSAHETNCFAAMNVFYVGKNSSLEYCVFYDALDKNMYFSGDIFYIGKDSSLDYVVCGNGVRQNYQCLYVECDTNSTVKINQSFIVAHAQHVCKSHIVHKGIGSFSDQSLHVALGDSGSIDFSGHITVQKKCSNVKAYMKHASLSYGANTKCFSEPFLSIDCHDVECSHGVSMSSFDKNALFYLCQKGLDIDKAKSLLINSFLLSNLTYFLENDKYSENIYKALCA